MTTKRRPKGTGSITRTREGKFRAMFAFAVGKREDIDGSPFRTYEDAERALDALLAALEEAYAVRGGVTLRKLADKALRQRELDGYRSTDEERRVWDLRFDGWSLTGMPASSITRGDVRAHLASMRNLATGARLAKQTRSNALNLLRAVFAYGVEHELLAENPCDGLRVKDHGRSDDGSTFLRADEVTRLLEHATEPGVELAIGTGMRSGELRTLHWEDVRDDRIVVRYGGIKDGKLMPPKSGRIREIPILPHARAAIARLRQAYGDETPTGIVLRSKTHYYRARGQVFDRLEWKAWLAAAKLGRRVRPHDLRHTTATLLLTGAWGRAWSYEEVKEMLGHSSVKVTERYAKAVGTLAHKAAREMVVGSGQDRGHGTDFATQAREILQRRGSDSNRRMTVLQVPHRAPVSRGGVDLAILCRSFVQAVADGSPFALSRGLDLAEAVLDTVALSDEARSA